MEEKKKKDLDGVERIEDDEDLRLLRTARRENEGKPLLTHAEMMKELGLEWSFHRALMRNDRFRAGDFDTHFLETFDWKSGL
jgi:hypothetical protein